MNHRDATLPRLSAAGDGAAGRGADGPGLAARVAALEAERAALEAALADSRRTVAALRAGAASPRDGEPESGGPGDDLAARLVAAEGELAALRSHGVELEKRQLALLRSTSWRLLEPARALARLATRRKAPPPFKPRLLDPDETPPLPSPARSGGVLARLLDPTLYVNKLFDIRHSRARGSLEFVPFAIEKPAARRQAAGDGARFVFAIPLSSAETVADWAHTERLLEQTLRSLIVQTDPDWTAIIAGHERPDVPALADERIEFVSIDRPRPRDKSKFRADKAAKRHALGRRLAQMGGGYFMQLDADDLVRDDFVATVRSGAYPHGAVAARGYALDYINRRLAPVPGAWRLDLHNVCGSCSAVYYTLADLPTMAHKTNDQSLPFNMTRQHAYTAVVMEEFGRPLERLPEPMVVYLVNHAQNLSFSLQKAGSRGANIVEAVARCALPEEEARAALARFGVTDWP
jgi:hypothetical protein